MYDGAIPTRAQIVEPQQIAPGKEQDHDGSFFVDGLGFPLTYGGITLGVQVSECDVVTLHIPEKACVAAGLSVAGMRILDWSHEGIQKPLQIRLMPHMGQNIITLWKEADNTSTLTLQRLEEAPAVKAEKGF